MLENLLFSYIYHIFSGGKGNFFEGGMRVPGIIRWPGRIPHDTVSSQVISQMDIFPTLVNMVGGKMPNDRVMDGRDILPTLTLITSENKTQSLRADEKRALFFYCNDKLFSVRYGDFKFHFKTMPVKSKEGYAETCGEAGFPNDYYFNCLFCFSPCVQQHDPPLIFNLASDPGEIYALNPDLNQGILQELYAVVEQHESQLVKGPALFTSLSVQSIPCCDRSSPGCSCNYP